MGTLVQMHRIIGLAAVATIVAACAGQPDEATTETSIASSTAPTAATTTSSSTTTSTTTPTTTEPTVDVHYEVWIYDTFETTDGLTLGSGCFGVGERINIKETARILLRSDADNSVVGSTKLPAGVVEYDDSGPKEGERGEELFYRCTFAVDFVDLSLEPAGNYRMEFPGGVLSDVFTTEDLDRGIATGFLLQNLEAERQRIRAEQ